MSLNFNPLYRQVREHLVGRMRSGDWNAGEPLPAEIELAKELGVSQGTVRKAIDSLVTENLVVRRQGRGTYVATHEEPVAQFRFLRMRPNIGEPVQPESQILSVESCYPTEGVAGLLGVDLVQACLLIKRVLSFEGRPVVLDEIWLPPQQFEGLTQELLQNYKGPLYGLFESQFKVRMIRCEERLTARQASEEQARILNVAASTALLIVERVSFGYEEKPMEVRIGSCVTEGFHYLNFLS